MEAARSLRKAGWSLLGVAVVTTALTYGLSAYEAEKTNNEAAALSVPLACVNALRKSEASEPGAAPAVLANCQGIGSDKIAAVELLVDAEHSVSTIISIGAIVCGVSSIGVFAASSPRQVSVLR